MGKSKLKSRMKNLLMFLPNMVILCCKLMVDNACRERNARYSWRRSSTRSFHSILFPT